MVVGVGIGHKSASLRSKQISDLYSIPTRTTRRRRTPRSTKNQNPPNGGIRFFSAPWVGIEPTTNSLTANCSTAELPRNMVLLH